MLLKITKRKVVNHIEVKDQAGNWTGKWFVELSCGHARMFENRSCYPPSKSVCHDCAAEIERPRVSK